MRANVDSHELVYVSFEFFIYFNCICLISCTAVKQIIREGRVAMLT